jgi:hypothetical protein
MRPKLELVSVALQFPGLTSIKDVEEVRTEFEVSVLPNLKTPERGNVPVHSGESVDRVAAGGA